MSFNELIEENEGIGTVRDVGVLKHPSPEYDGKKVVIVEDVDEAMQGLSLFYGRDFDLILSYDAYGKCDYCGSIYEVEELSWDEDGNRVCSYCNTFGNKKEGD